MEEIKSDFANTYIRNQSMSERVEHRLTILEHLLCTNFHLIEPDVVDRYMNKLRVHYKHMSKEDQLYMDSAEIIVRERIPFSE